MIIKIIQGNIINVLSGEIETADIMIKDRLIIGVGDFTEVYADKVINAKGRYICPSFIDSHIHIESSMLLPREFAKVAVKHGTGAIIADPHEIANVCGTDGIDFMLQTSENELISIYYMMPSCVPASPLDESGATLLAKDIQPYYSNDKVLGLGEVMNYVGVLAGDNDLLLKIRQAKECGKVINGHAPLLTGDALEKYISYGITDDHECTSAKEGTERIAKGQKVFIRQGSAAKNLEALLPLFEKPFAKDCMLATDDKHPSDLLKHGHIDEIIRLAVRKGKSAVTAIQMATIQAAGYYNLKNVGALTTGYIADLVILDNLDDFNVLSVFKNGANVYNADNEIVKFSIKSDNYKCDIKETILGNNNINSFDKFIDYKNINEKNNTFVCKEIQQKIYNSFNLRELNASDFIINNSGINKARVIEIVQGELLTNEVIKDIIFDINNGVNISNDIVKIAVIERHKNTGHIGLGFIKGTGLKKGACASSISHDSHNLIIVGTNVEDMFKVGNRIREIGGGIATICDGEITSELALPVGGIMSDKSAEEVAFCYELVHKSIHDLGVPEHVELLMTTSFISLPVIPHIKITCKGLVNVDKQEFVPLLIDD